MKLLVNALGLCLVTAVVSAGCSSADGEPSELTPGASADAGQDTAPQVDAADRDAIGDDASDEQGQGTDAESSEDAAEPQPDAAVNPFCEIDDEHQYACCVFDGVNVFRQAHGVGLVDYVWHDGVAEMADWYSEQMRDLGVFAHGVDGRKCGSRMSSFGIDWSSCGENLARNTYDSWQESCASVVQQWAGSTAGHREAMLEDKWSYAGVGVAQGGGWWWTTMNFLEP